MNAYALLVIVGMVLVFIDMLIALIKGTPLAQHALLSVGVLIIGIALLSGSPIITSLHS